MRELEVLGKRHADYLSAHPGSAAAAVRVQEYRWMLEEYRVSVFAQQLGTVAPVSPKRLEKLWEELLARS